MGMFVGCVVADQYIRTYTHTYTRTRKHTRLHNTYTRMFCSTTCIQGRTALMLAIQKRKKKLVPLLKALLGHEKCDPDIQDRDVS